MQRLEFYTVSELERIVTRSAGILGVPIDAPGAGFCSACLTGDYPIIADAELSKAALEKSNV